jgi:hypothetical protein
MNKFTYGDSVLLLKPQQPGENAVYASVVSITPIETDAQAKHFNAPIGTVFYTVEFADGSDAFVSEVRQQSFFPPQSALRQGRSASAFCQSTSVPDAACYD